MAKRSDRIRTAAAPLSDWRNHDSTTSFTRASSDVVELGRPDPSCDCTDCEWKRIMGPTYCRMNGLHG